MQKTPALLALADGSIFHGYAIGAIKEHVVGEVVFNTAMSGYQEILSDHSYRGQIVVFTFPHIGIVGTNAEDNESNGPQVVSCIMHDIAEYHSNWRSESALVTYLETHQIMAITGVDTRALTQHIRTHGSMNGVISTAVENHAAVCAIAQQAPGIQQTDLSLSASTPTTYNWQETSWRAPNSQHTKTPYPFHIVVVDFGVKHEILRQLANVCARVTVVPCNSTAADITALKPDGIVLSNGPGDPRMSSDGVALTHTLMAGDTPIYGICFGHQLMALSQGAKINSMAFGHHGANHPLQDCDSGCVSISSQNHNFVVAEDPLPSHIHITHRSLFDQTIAGIRYLNTPHQSFQGHPEAGPGPTESTQIFTDFMDTVASTQAQQERDHA